MKLRAIYISPEHNYFGHYGQPAGEAPTVALTEADLVAGQGIVGDRFYGFKEDYRGQVTFFDQAMYEDLCSRFQVRDKDAGVFRRNLIVSNIDLNSLIGKEFEIQGVRFRGMAECSPCEWMDQAFCPGAEAALKGHGGLRAKVLSSGRITCEV
jgi:MOSC domain-containing protein YiiM